MDEGVFCVFSSINTFGILIRTVSVCARNRRIK